MEQPKQELCTIRIMFPVKSDEQAIEIKKKIAAELIDIPDAQLHFALLPAKPPTPGM
ncbi:MAG: hypothetical protein HWN68_19645 [Desulfobacterales bacterium]|nr:hypothetical protein [Desulfobacterales bacterium]